ncbi:MAG: hypothetical protein JO359_07235, partial [Candidatus Eremiobacteraeota bacterium]|nr:hypothetical protein [Candidatus Eremiobacteraeota bacterium]
MIYDCCIVADELDLLELRMRILDSVVDRFVVCESPFTFRGAPKPLAFSAAGERFAPWSSKIVALVYPGPASADPWENEFGQRDYLAQALDGCAGDDLILLSDADEIPDPANAGQRPRHKPLLGHRQRLSIGYVNRIWPEPWIGTRSLTFAELEKFGKFSQLRMRGESELEVVDGGWHFSALGGAAAYRRKMKTYAHSEYDLPYFTDARRLELTIDDESEAKWIPLDESFPQVLREPRWAAYVWKKPAPADRAATAALEHAHGCFAYVPADAESVAVIGAGAAWLEAGRERFGERFAGTNLEGAQWVVIDGLQNVGQSVLARLRNSGARLVAHARNARSFRSFEDALGGKPFPPGRALGRREYEAIAFAYGRLAGIDRLQTRGAFTPWSRMPEVISNAWLGDFGFARTTREAVADFLAEAFILRLEPAQ